MNKPLLSEYEVCFFPLAGVMTPVEVCLYKTYISAERGQNFSQHYFENSMAEYLSAIGAIKVFDGEISTTEYERFHRQDPNKGSEGDIGYAGQNINFWVLRSPAHGSTSNTTQTTPQQHSTSCRCWISNKQSAK